MNKKFILGALSILAFTTSLIFINFASAESFLTQHSGSQLESPGATLLVEDFTYPPGSLLTNNGWTAHSAGGTNPIVTSAPGLTFTGYPSSGVGNSVALATSGEDVNRTFAAQSTGMVYAAFMVNTSDAAVDPIGGYFFHLGPDPISTTFRGRVFIKKDASNNIAFGISKAGSTTAADIAFTPFSYSLNTTYLVVVKYTIVDGAGNDTVSLFVLTTTPATEPAPTLTAPDTSASDISPATVALRQGSAATSPTVRVDGIRVGTSWADVTQSGGGTPTPTPVRDANVDFNGDGKSDWVVTRAEGGGDSQITWFISHNGANNLIVTQFGLSTDVRVPEDYDGDGKDDIAVWRNNSPGSNRAYFFILQSMTNTVRIEQFGQTGDDPRVVADYDGDNKADLAVYRTNANGQNFFFYRSSLTNNNFTSVAFGAGSNVRPYVGDFDGDGKADFAVHVNGQFIVLINGGNTVEYINWGAPNDFLVPGDFDGDGRSDFCVVRQIGNQWVWFILERDGGGTGANGIVWGLVPDTLAPGDYDGDGRQDVAVWRSNPDATMNFFFVRRSSDSTLLTYEWGRQGDRAEAFWYVQVGAIVLRNGLQ